MKVENGTITLVTTADLGTMHRTMAAVVEYQSIVGWTPQPTEEDVLTGEPTLYTPLVKFCLRAHDADLDLFIALHRGGFMSDLARPAAGFLGE